MKMQILLARLVRLAAALIVALVWVAPASAVPSYARQTGSECMACHVGAYGPHLTPYGIRFKLGGYTDSDGKGSKLPLAAQAQVTYTQPTTSNPALGGGKSDTRLSEADLYLAGKWFDGVGSYIRLQHLEGPSTTRQTALSDVDIRFARETKLDDNSVQWGLSFNNNPGIQDPLDVLPAWGFGAAGPGRDGVTGTLTGTLLNRFQGGLADRVAGVSAYGLLNSHWYGELATYRSLSAAGQKHLGETPFKQGTDVGDPGRLGANAYWRLAYLQDMKTWFVSAGVVGFDAALQPGPARTGPSDKVKDLGIDLSYEYLGNRDHVLQLRANTIRERRDYGTSLIGVPFPPFALPASPTGTVTEKTLSATYFYQGTWGITVAGTRSDAKDAVRFQPYGAADTNFVYIQPMWTVFGKEDSWGAPGFNLQFGGQWIRFQKFNGSSTAIFGNSPFVPLADAKDLNAWTLYAKVAF